MTDNSELRQLFLAQQLLRHPDAAWRWKAGIRLAKIAHRARHDIVRRRALELLGQELGCHLIQSPGRNAVVAVTRQADDGPRFGRVAAR